MEVENFYITLLSNSSNTVFKNNVLSSFTNILNTPLNLSGPWVVGITEIFVNKLKTIKKRNADSDLPSYNILDDFHKKLIGFPENESKEIDPKKGKSIDTKKVENDTKKVENVTVGFPYFPGYTEDFYEPLHSLKSSIDHHCDIIKNYFPQNNDVVSHAFIYLDIMKPRLVGDQSIKCLRIFPKTNSQQNIEFTSVEYYPIQSNYITDISILIANNNGDKINFENSKIPTMCTLHFKRK